jgi:hypothetical protein
MGGPGQQLRERHRPAEVATALGGEPGAAGGADLVAWELQNLFGNTAVSGALGLGGPGTPPAAVGWADDDPWSAGLCEAGSAPASEPHGGL